MENLERKLNSAENESAQESEQIYEEINIIDKLLTNISLEAERSIKPRGQIKWSSEAIQCQKDCVALRYEKQRAKKAGNIEEMKNHKKEIMKKSNELELILKNQKDSFINDLKSKIEDIPDIPATKQKKSKLRNQIKNIFEKRMYEKIKYATGKIKPYSPPQVEIQIGEKATIINDPDEIAEKFRDHNRHHFAQAQGCKLTEEAFDEITNMEQFNKIQTDRGITEWKIREAINSISVEQNSLDINSEEWIQKFKHWKESTSTSPSGVHLGHYKVLIETIFVPEDTQMIPDIEIYNKQQVILDAHLRLINAILKHGKSILRWQRCNNICIPKKQGCIEIDKFRNIHIYECDLNAVLAIKWKGAIFTSEKEGKLSESQFGSRKSKNSQLPILLEILQNDISRLTRTSYGQINYDAKACYDRILPILAALVSSSYGVHQKIVLLHNHLLKNMKYHVTITGSQQEWKFYNTSNHPIYGTGQGSGNSPHIWTMMSSILLHILNTEAEGAVYDLPDGTKRKAISTAYVDDVNTHHNTNMEGSEELYNSMARDFQRWQDILAASGGKLASDKCTFYASDWEFTTGGKPVMRDIHIKSYQQLSESLSARRISVSNYHKSLGHLISPKEPSRTQRIQLEEISDRFEGILKQDNLTVKEYETLYRSTYTPTIRYVLQGSCMNDKELYNASKRNKRQFLQKLRYSKTTASEIVHGSPELGGIGLMDFYTEQGLLNIQLLTKALSDQQLVGDITKAALSKWKWQIGTGKNPFTSKQYTYPQDESRWLRTVREFLIRNNIEICIGENEFPLQRENDKYIMEVAEEMGFTPFELRFLNHCRLFLNVISISDITSDSGKSVDPTVMKFKKLPNQQSDPRTHQSKPDHTKWSIWFKFITNITRQQQSSLKKPLGKWIVNYRQLRKHYTCYRTTDKIYKEREGEVDAQKITNSRVNQNIKEFV